MKKFETARLRWLVTGYCGWGLIAVPTTHLQSNMSSLRFFFPLAAAVLFNEASGFDTTTAVFRDFADSKNRISATATADGIARPSAPAIKPNEHGSPLMCLFCFLAAVGARLGAFFVFKKKKED